jgi:hypothetical protein
MVREHLRPERRLRRAGLGLVAVCVVVIAAYGVSQVFGEKRAATPGIDNATGLYRQSAINWPLCTVFILLGAIILFALMIEASS